MQAVPYACPIAHRRSKHSLTENVYRVTSNSVNASESVRCTVWTQDSRRLLTGYYTLPIVALGGETTALEASACNEPTQDGRGAFTLSALCPLGTARHLGGRDPGAARARLNNASFSIWPSDSHGYSKAARTTCTPGPTLNSCSHLRYGGRVLSTY